MGLSQRRKIALDIALQRIEGNENSPAAALPRAFDDESRSLVMHRDIQRPHLSL